MVERFARTGTLPPQLPSTEPVDFDSVMDFQTAMNAVIAGENAFMSLPAKLRERFQNSPQQFLDFLSTPANYDEAVKLGLVVPRQPPAEPSVQSGTGSGAVAPAVNPDKP